MFIWHLCRYQWQDLLQFKPPRMYFAATKFVCVCVCVCVCVYVCVCVCSHLSKYPAHEELGVPIQTAPTHSFYGGILSKRKTKCSGMCCHPCYHPPTNLTEINSSLCCLLGFSSLVTHRTQNASEALSARIGHIQCKLPAHKIRFIPCFYFFLKQNTLCRPRKIGYILALTERGKDGRIWHRST